MNEELKKLNEYNRQMRMKKAEEEALKPKQAPKLDGTGQRDIGKDLTNYTHDRTRDHKGTSSKPPIAT